MPLNITHKQDSLFAGNAKKQGIPKVGYSEGYLSWIIHTFRHEDTKSQKRVMVSCSLWQISGNRLSVSHVCLIKILPLHDLMA